MRVVDFLVILKAFALPELHVISKLNSCLESFTTLALVLVDDFGDQSINLVLVSDVFDVCLNVPVLVEQGLEDRGFLFIGRRVWPRTDKTVLALGAFVLLGGSSEVDLGD